MTALVHPIEESQDERILRDAKRNMATASNPLAKLQALKNGAASLAIPCRHGSLHRADVEAALYEQAENVRLVEEVGDSVVEIAIRDGLNAEVLPEEQAPAVSSLPLVRPPDWEGTQTPERRWLVKDRLPAGDVSILLGDGGTGKPLIALQLATAMARGAQDWLGAVIEPGPVLMYSGEENEDEIRRRIERIAELGGFTLSELANLHLHFPALDKVILGVPTPADRIAPTPEFLALKQTIETVRPALLIVDSVAATYGGNQNSRTQTRSFISMFRAPAHTYGLTILLLDHPSMAGLNSGEGRGGSVDWQNACRARLYLKHISKSNDDDEGAGDLRDLTTKKANYGPSGEATRIRWSRGIFVVDGSGSSIEQAAAEQKIDDLFLTLLDQFSAQGLYLTPAMSRSGAAATFAAHSDAGKVTAKAFQKAQDRLFKRGVLTTEQWGPASRGKRKIIRTVNNAQRD